MTVPSSPAKSGPPLRTRRKSGFYIGGKRNWPGAYLTLDGRFLSFRWKTGLWLVSAVADSPTQKEDAELLRNAGLASTHFRTRRASLSSLLQVTHEL